MSLAKLTLRGIENYLNMYEDSLFADAGELPEGINPELLYDVIFDRSNEFEVLYADPDYLKLVTNMFFAKHYQTFERWQQIVDSEYDPTSNYDRHEEYSGSGSGSGNGTAGSTETGKKAAFNSSAFENYDQSTTSGSSTSSYNNAELHELHAYGNIGVTTNVQMLKEHFEFWKGFNIYMAIADMYIAEVCLMVY